MLANIVNMMHLQTFVEVASQKQKTELILGAKMATHSTNAKCFKWKPGQYRIHFASNDSNE